MTMTPQQYHLDHGPKLRDEIVKQQAAAEQKEAKAERAALIAEARAAGILIPASASPYGYGNNCFRIGGLSFSISLIDKSKPHRMARRESGDEESSRLYRRRRALCDNLSPTGANRFAAFVKTKYGKDANAATIRKAHDEWLDMLSSCSC